MKRETLTIATRFNGPPGSGNGAGRHRRRIHPDELVEIDKLTELALELLNPRGFQKLVSTLKKIAAADGMQDRREAAMLLRVRAASELALN